MIALKAGGLMAAILDGVDYYGLTYPVSLVEFTKDDKEVKMVFLGANGKESIMCYCFDMIDFVDAEHAKHFCTRGNIESLLKYKSMSLPFAVF